MVQLFVQGVSTSTPTTVLVFDVFSCTVKILSCLQYFISKVAVLFKITLPKDDATYITN